MSIITLQEAQTWAELTKLNLGSLQSDLVAQIATQILSRIAQAYDVTGWTTSDNTPAIVRSIIAMEYVSWLYNKAYSEEEPGNNGYANRLLGMAEELISSIIAGTTEIIEVPIVTVYGQPVFYPTDDSSALVPTSDDPSLGGPYTTMGDIF